MRLGNSPINWSNEDMHDLGGDIPVEQCLSEMREAGYEGTEYGYKFPGTAATTKMLLAQYRLQLVSSWHSVYFVDGDAAEELDKLEQKVRFLAGGGADRINLCDVSRSVQTKLDRPVSARPIFTDAEWERLADGLNRAGEVCLRHGVTPGYHFHIGTGVQTAAEVDRLMAMTDPARVWLCADSGHAAYAGDDPEAVFAAHADRIAHVHFKDVRTEVMERARAGDWPFLKAVVEGVFTVPGDGDIDFAPLVATLRRAGYDEWIVIEAEQYLPGTDPLTFARRCRAYLEPLLREA